MVTMAKDEIRTFCWIRAGSWPRHRYLHSGIARWASRRISRKQWDYGFPGASPAWGCI